LRKIDLPAGIVPVGSLHDPIVRLDIPSCGNATIWEHDGVRYIRPSDGCSLDARKKHHDADKLEVERLARKHRVAVEALQPMGLTIERLKQKGVQIPEQHSCQDGVLWLGPYYPNQRRAKEVPAGRPSWIVEAEKKLTKYPYSLLFSLIRLVTEPRAGDPFDDCVPPNKVLEWCSMYGLPDTEEWHADERYGCLQLNRFQGETVILYLLFHLWKALIEWQLFEADSGPSDPEDIDRHRGAIHGYAHLLLLLRNGGSTVLGWAMNREQHLKQQLDRGIFVYVEPKTKQECDLKEEYKRAKAEVDYVARVAIDEVIEGRIRLRQFPSVAASRMIVRAPSVFDACYLQLGQLMLKPANKAVRHLKYCAEPSCGQLFWAPHGHNAYCEEDYSRRARWAAKNRTLSRSRPSAL
jgi:hypothetical protein